MGNQTVYSDSRFFFTGNILAWGNIGEYSLGRGILFLTLTNTRNSIAIVVAERSTTGLNKTHKLLVLPVSLLCFWKGNIREYLGIFPNIPPVREYCSKIDQNLFFRANSFFGRPSWTVHGPVNRVGDSDHSARNAEPNLAENIGEYWRISTGGGNIGLRRSTHSPKAPISISVGPRDTLELT